MHSLEWHIITPEYPPQTGGVSDYTRLVSEGLVEQGDSVHVWCPTLTGGVPIQPDGGRGPVTVHRGELARLGKELDEFARPRRLLVQWVPHGYGYRSMNLGFCLWLWRRARVRKDTVEIMIHEPFLAFREGSWRQDAVAIVHRVMIVILLHSATRVWVSIPAWIGRLKPYMLWRRVPIEWLPIPSGLEVRSQRARRANPESGRLKIGHFGTYGARISQMLETLAEPLLRADHARVLVLMGRGSEEFRHRLVTRNPELREQIQATGTIPAAEVSSRISECDLMVQPYPDGISSRRTSAMAALSHAKAIVTTEGRLTEEIWRRGEAVALLPTDDVTGFVCAAEDLLSNAEKRYKLGLRARDFYLKHFDVWHTIEALRSDRERSLLSCAS